MSDTHETHRAAEPIETPFSVSHFFHVLRVYGPVIRLSMIAIFVGYVIVALGVYLVAPSERVSQLPFRLEFEGAERGQYPNGAKFSSTEIISTPILLKVFSNNKLDRFTSFETFSSSVVVLESNAAQEALGRNYKARLSDPRLTPVDRDRIQREYELKIASLNKSEFAILYLDGQRVRQVPQVVVDKVLLAILKEWANTAARDQHVLEYRVAVLSPNIVSKTTLEQNNPVVATEVLRSRIQRVLTNIADIRELPSAELVRSSKDSLSLVDVSIRLDDMVRFRLEPLTHHIATAGLDDRVDTIQFLETQLANDQRQLDSSLRVADAARSAMAMYMNGQTSSDEATRAAAGLGPPQSRSSAGSETVMPQLSDSFIERLIQLTSSSTDHDFRQRLAERYREAAVAVVPLQRAVAYDKSVLDLVRSSSGGGHHITRDVVEEQIAATRAEARQLLEVVHEIYRQISANLNPSTELMTITAPATNHVERSVGAKQVALVGLALLLIGLPVVILLCLLHNRVREEEVAEEIVAAAHAAESAG